MWRCLGCSSASNLFVLVVMFAMCGKLVNKRRCILHYVGCVLTAGFIVGSRRCGLELKSSVCPSLSTCMEVVVVWCWLWRRLPRTSSIRLMSSCRLPRLQNVTRRATELSLDIFRERLLEVDCCSVKDVSLAHVRAVGTFWSVFCLSVCSVLSVYDGCVPWMCSFHKWLYSLHCSVIDWVVVLHWIVRMYVCIVRDR